MNVLVVEIADNTFWCLSRQVKVGVIIEAYNRSKLAGL